MLKEVSSISFYPLKNGNVLVLLKVNGSIEGAVVNPAELTVEKLQEIAEPINSLAKGELLDSSLVDFHTIQKFCIVKTFKDGDNIYKSYTFVKENFHEAKVGTLFSTEEGTDA